MGTRYLLFLLMFVSLPVWSQSAYLNGISKELLLGKIKYEEQQDFIKVPKEHASRPMFLNTDTYTAFIQMYNAAKRDGISLQIISGARNFDQQKTIWERKWQGNKDLDPETRTQKILEFSSMPSTSRHHWGTEIDLNNLENSYFEHGKGKAEYEWLVKNASRFGFHQVYNSKATGRTGYAEEKWHWSYLPLAGSYLEKYNQLINYIDINGFEGAYLAKTHKMISAYVNGIAQSYPENFLVTFPKDEEIPEAEGE